jgi:hypothetical protein
MKAAIPPEWRRVNLAHQRWFGLQDRSINPRSNLFGTPQRRDRPAISPDSFYPVTAAFPARLLARHLLGTGIERTISQQALLVWGEPPPMTSRALPFALCLVINIDIA